MLALLPQNTQLKFGGMSERPKEADCKSAGNSLRRFESYSLHIRGRMTEDRGRKLTEIVS